MEMEVEVRMLDGKSTRVAVRPQDNVACIKKKLLDNRKNTFVSSPLFHLFLRGSKLSLEDSVKSLGLSDKEFMVLIPYLRKKKGFIANSESSCPLNDSVIAPPEHTIYSSGWQEKEALSSFSKDASSSVWDEIAADLSSWKESSDVVHGGMRGLSLSSQITQMSQASSILDLCPTLQRKEGQCVNESTLENALNEASCKIEEKLFGKKRHTRRYSGKDQDTAAEEGFSILQKKAKKTWSCPVALKQLYSIFRALNLIYGFLQKQHMQGTWLNMKEALRQLCGGVDQIQVVDIENLALLFPQVVQIALELERAPTCLLTLICWIPQECLIIKTLQGLCMK